MATTIFTKIIAGETPCFRIYEDDKVFAFLDINPLSRGHTLVIPKEPAETLDQLSEESAAALGRALPRISRAILRATAATAFNLLQNNGATAHQAVLHVHFHIIPKYEDGTGLGLQWSAQSLSADEGKQLVTAISAQIG
jgi:histidine triad (HIT) family protein